MHEAYESYKFYLQKLETRESITKSLLLLGMILSGKSYCQISNLFQTSAYK